MQIRKEGKINKINKENIVNKIPRNDCYVSLYETNGIIELTATERFPQKLNNYIRLSATELLNKSTGEIKQYSHHNTSNKNINRSLTSLRRLINNNFVGNKNEIHITLTYSKLELDKNKVSSNFKKFWKKVRYRYSSLEYIAIYEKHNSGGWHIHCLAKDITGQELYIPHCELTQLWQQGYVYITKVHNNKNIGAYFSKYAKLDDNSKSIADYPKNGKLYSSSRGIQKPIKRVMTYSEALELTKDKKLMFHETYNIVYIDGEIKKDINTIHYMQFNSK